MVPHQFEHVARILNKNNYRVTAFVEEDGGLLVLPARFEVEELHIHYKYLLEGVEIVISDASGMSLWKDLIECPVYLHRLLLLTHVSAQCIAINYAISLIRFVDKSGEETDEGGFWASSLSSFVTQEDIDKEDLLRPIIVRCIFSSFDDDAERFCYEHEIEGGYLILKAMLLGDDTDDEVGGEG